MPVFCEGRDKGKIQIGDESVESFSVRVGGYHTSFVNSLLSRSHVQTRFQSSRKSETVFSAFFKN